MLWKVKGEKRNYKYPQTKNCLVLAYVWLKKIDVAFCGKMWNKKTLCRARVALCLSRKSNARIANIDKCETFTWVVRMVWSW